MTFWTVEQSVASGVPIELHEFHAKDTNTYWRHADAPVDIVFNGFTWTAIYIKGGPLESGTNSLRNQTEVTIDPESTLAAACITASPEQPIEYIRYKLQGSDYIRSFTGGVVAIRFTQADRDSPAEAVLSVDPGYQHLKAAALLPRYGRLCGVPLYSPACSVDPASFSWTGTITSVDTVDVTSSDLETDPDGQLLGGCFSAQSYSRKIVAHSSWTVTLSAQISGLTSSTSFSVKPGCPHTPVGCATFANFLNYRGQPYMPSKNPFGGDAICY